MAEKSQDKDADKDQGGFFNRFIRMSRGIDPLDAGAAGIATYLLYNFFGGSPLPKAPEAVAPDLADEANFERLLCYMETYGGSMGAYFADHLFALDKALSNVHEVYGKQFRDKFFSGLKEESILDRLNKLFNEAGERNDSDAWHHLTSVNDMIVKVALRIARRVESHIRGDADREKAVALVARQMIDNKELPGSTIAHTEAKLEKMTDHLTDYLRHRIETRNKERIEAEESGGNHGLSWKEISLITIVVLLFLFVMSTSVKYQRKMPIKASNSIVEQVEQDSKPSKNPDNTEQERIKSIIEGE